MEGVLFLRRRQATKTETTEQDTPSTLKRGHRAETLAAEHLGRNGLVLLERNARAGRGEIDLVMRDRDTLVFVEVRSRRSRAMVNASESITPAKRQKVIETAERLLLQHHDWQRLHCRFDVVAIEWHPRNGQVAVDWIRDAFS